MRKLRRLFLVFLLFFSFTQRKKSIFFLGDLEVDLLKSGLNGLDAKKNTIMFSAHGIFLVKML